MVYDPRFLVCIKCSSDAPTDDGIEVCFSKKFTEDINFLRRKTGNDFDPYEAGGEQMTISTTEVCHFAFCHEHISLWCKNGTGGRGRRYGCTAAKQNLFYSTEPL